MAKKAKGNRVQVILECTEQKDSGVPGISRYITTKNKKNTTERLERRKYNPYLRRVTVHKFTRKLNKFSIWQRKRLQPSAATRPPRGHLSNVSGWKNPTVPVPTSSRKIS